jgi:hypothetical protein
MYMVVVVAWCDGIMCMVVVVVACCAVDSLVQTVGDAFFPLTNHVPSFFGSFTSVSI